MKLSLTDELCTKCGLCCDGSLFADVELKGPAEATRLEVLGLRLDEDSDDPLLQLPCSALRGTRCSVYAHRPECCRTFECLLLQEARRGRVSVDRAGERITEALRRIRHVKELLAQLGQRNTRLPLRERCAGVFAGRPAGTAEERRKRVQLEIAMSDVEDLLRKHFLPL